MSRRGSSPSLNTEPQEQEGLNSQEAENISVEAELGPPNRKYFNFREKSWFGKKCVKIFRVFTNTFAMTFLAEWGDRWEYALSLELWKIKTYKFPLSPVIGNDKI